MSLTGELRKIGALTKRDMYNWSTYKSQAITTIVGGLIGIAAWGFNADFVNRPVPEYNTDYISFLIVGVLVSQLVLPIGTGVQKQLNPWTLETILMTGIKAPTFILGTSLWAYVLSVIFFIPQLFIGIYVFGAHLTVNFPSLLVSVFISTLIVFCLSMISTGIRMVTKVTDPVTWGLAIAASVLSGVAYPVEKLNHYIPGLSTVSWFLPQTWIYHIIRLATLEAGSMTDLSILEPFLVTLAYAVALVPVAFYAYRWGLNRAKRDGTLGWL